MPPTAEQTRRGLTAAEVERRRAEGRHNELPTVSSRRVRDIVRANVLTRFTAIIVVLAGVVLVVGRPADAIFAGVLVCNIAIGIVQEVRAKRTLDRLVDLIAPTVAVRRDGAVGRVGVGELVVDDVLELEPGDQVPVDAVVLDSRGVELDESALTGESDPVSKQPGDEVLSGSAVLAGSATVRAVRVGREARIHALVSEAGRFSLARSELRAGVDRVLQVISWGLVPLAALLLWSQLRASSSVRDGLVSAVAGVIGLVPQGLVLLVSLALAVAVGRLARQHVVIQELFAVECLARVDVLCVDKTGTLTTGAFRVEAVTPLGKWEGSESDGDGTDLRGVVAALVAAEPNPNATMAVLGRELGTAPPWAVSARVAFSSARKWSGATFEPGGTWLLGAPEVLLEAAPAVQAAAVAGRVEAAADAGRRVLLVAHSPHPLVGEQLPAGLEPAGLIELSEELRPDAAATMAYFARQGVAVKVISGDNPRTVSAVAARVGLDGADRQIDLRRIDLTGDARTGNSGNSGNSGNGATGGSSSEVDELVAATTVFGRVLPEQKRDLVRALQRAGHVVAMTGDGVNDIPALKQADIGIAMDTATPATRAVARLVLLDGRFDHLPDVVAEGRRVIANMERVSSLFLTKTVYSAIFAVVVAVSGVVYPYLPRQMSLVSELTVGIPAFVLSFRAVDRPVGAGYLGRVLRFAVPSGIAAALVVLASDRLDRVRLTDPTGAEARTLATVSLVLVALWIVYRLVQPVDRAEGLLLGGLVALFVLVLSVPQARALYGLELPAADVAAAATATTIGCIAVLEAVLRAVQRALARRARSDDGGQPRSRAA
jgi:cation-transporting ATPase E